MSEIEILKERFSVPGVSFEEGPGKFTVIAVKTAAAEAKIALHGAHLLSYAPAGEKPVLWMSGWSDFRPDRPIRGGVPVCWPWFGKEAQPQHGYARVAEWTVRQIVPEGSGAAVTLALPASQLPAEVAARGLSASITFTVGETLTIALTTVNEGKSPQDFSEALHTYFAVSDVRRIRVDGLDNEPFIDTVPGREPGPHRQPGPVTVSAELDRAYLQAAGGVTLIDDGWSRQIAIDKTGSHSAVVWNPWIDKSRAMADFGDGEYLGMICIEAANVRDDRVTLAPGESHTLTQRIAVESL